MSLLRPGRIPPRPSPSTRAPCCWPRWPACPRPRSPASGWRCGLNSTSPRSPRPGDEDRAAPLPLGQVLDRNGVPAGNLSLPTASLNRHVFVCGATGAGKSQTVRALLEGASGAGLPWLVVEPAKAEYRLMSVRLNGTLAGWCGSVPGRRTRSPPGSTPCAPAVDAAGRRFPLQTHADLVRALFLASFAADEPFPQVLSAAVTRVYEEAGWDLALGEPVTPGVQPRYPTLGDLQAAAERIVSEIGYGREITDNVRGFITVRLSSLRLGTTGRFFEGGHPIDFGKLMARNVVFEIEDVGDDRDKAFLMGTVLIQLTEHLRLQARASGAAAAPRCGTCRCSRKRTGCCGGRRITAAAPGPPRTRWKCSPGCWPRSGPTARA